MALKTFVKISSVNNLSDARYCAGMYVDLMGFSLEENNRNYISPDKFKEITDWLSGLEYVAEFDYAHPEKILTKVQEYPGIQYLEIQEEMHLKMLSNTSYGIILKQITNDIASLDDLISKAASYKDHGIILLLVSEKLTLSKDVIGKIKELSNNCQVLLGFGLEADSILTALEMTGAKGIALQGGNEIKPGLKDFDELADLLEALEIED